MTTAQKNRSIPPEVMAELEDAVRLALSGIRDPEAMRRACERMDRMREMSDFADDVGGSEPNKFLLMDLLNQLLTSGTEYGVGGEVIDQRVGVKKDR